MHNPLSLMHLRKRIKNRVHDDQLHTTRKRAAAHFDNRKIAVDARGESQHQLQSFEVHTHKKTEDSLREDDHVKFSGEAPLEYVVQVDLHFSLSGSFPKAPIKL